MAANEQIVLGKDLQVGDVIKVWWHPHYDRITKIVPYEGKLAFLWDKEGGARYAHFEIARVPCLIEPMQEESLAHRPGVGVVRA